MNAPLPVRDAYRLWAPDYERENAVSALDDEAVRQLSPPVAGRTLLDVGCGTGRRLRLARDAALALGIDLEFAMLAAGARGEHCVAAGDVLAMPIRDGVVDVVWCRLVLGHIVALETAYHEFARVAARDAHLIVTDFHPVAAAAGHTRSFRDREGVRRTVEHYVHDVAHHERAAAHAGWRLDRTLDTRIGPAVRSFYEYAGMTARYDADAGMPLVLAMSFRR